MTPGEWNRVKDLFEAALKLPRDERTRMLATHPDSSLVMEEVRSLLTAYEDSPDFLETTAREAPEPLAGRRMGPWELVRELGRGGMGVVWLARRADGQYEQAAAVKLLPLGLLSRWDIGRFRDERQILARLDHPGIARLLDGGTLEDGSPYLVMEYIEGPPLDRWCESRELGVRERLQLFLAVCDAVDYAHRHLIIHRDLKPANILVTPEGTPKLLDFGIAKLIERNSEDTRTAWVLTPAYASPEQLRGAVVTTASDVFSLGVLLYVLLTGRKPFTAADGDPIELLRVICEQDPPLPSVQPGDHTRELKGDLDAITLQALRNDPDQRYHSVRALADDIRAWMDGRPVSASCPQWWERSWKWVRRHKTQAAAVGLAAFSLIGGTAVSLWQANVARRQSERAERRFNDIRRFSRSVLLELHDAIRNLPGATPARNLLLQRATEFLDNLAKEPSTDVAFKVELAEGYRRLGHVQGGSFGQNLGHRDAAAESFRKAVRWGWEAMNAAPSDPAPALLLLGAYDDLTRASIDQDEWKEADLWDSRHAAQIARVERQYRQDDRTRAALATSYSARGFYRTQRGDFAGAKNLYRKALSIFDALDHSRYGNADFRGQHAYALKRLGAILIKENSLDEAESRYRAALAIEDANVKSAPGDSTLRFDRTFTLSDLALILKRKKDYEHAAALYEEVLRTRGDALARDPESLSYIAMTANANRNLSGVYSMLRRHCQAIDLAREAVRLRDRSAAVTQHYPERSAAAEARLMLAQSIADGAEDRAFHPGPGERLSDANAALSEAGRLLASAGPGHTASVEDKSVLADYEELRKRLARLR